ncbi:Polyhydroxyalkanoic acid synthase [Pseudonocardia sp. Ae168_Ps1]|uniref:PHA/PHB synthase family protein n=1 Tax=unclassified Pseudonocardia TaxID=2619320 RepID=UPI000968B5C2|nr:MULTISPECIES: alpha/beta fold hydrolase [unclassified Pseudonocardia]OLL71033.1 Polyhydroxyalkanoic acid synthase [Pseudonocardia sp. Ae168_Ps1]OLL77417.1 Polyhydroxyalkanoic acid synthase [Pseudonocardia sp. Ae150A_Ps1]OLL88471.1 Polyhydroxyalkanoic acid synthase [Pseudonocardia sp. Ae263_Ps1]OLL91506.1 Polyhydroxyalkanoic acid synthase [Pseudonocardia sp. Ae356_Ps1]
MTTQPAARNETDTTGGAAERAGDATEVLRRQAAGLVRDLRELADPEGLRAKVDPVGFGGALGEAAKSLAGSPGAVLRAGFGFGVDSAKAVAAAASRAVGGTTNGPASLPEKDKRYADPAWEGNAWYYLARQEHALLADRLTELSKAARVSPVARRKLDWLVGQTVEALAPSNAVVTNPAWPKKIVETGGLNVVRGARNMLRDTVQNRGMPRQVTPGQYVVGKDLAVTPGHVVFRNRLIELIQYEPQTEKVHETPLLMSPPWINKYYIMDLAPGKSLVEWAVQHGHTVFMISYRNPDSALADLTMSDYLREGPIAAIDVVREITGKDKINVAGLCLGGALSAATVAWLEARGTQYVNSLTLMNTLLDYTGPGQLGVFTDEQTVNRLERSMRKDGYLPAASMKTTFDLLRATELVWNYVVNDWMLGEDPKPFDMLSWNADSTRMPAAMQTEYLRTLYLENRFAEGKLELAGERLGIADVRPDSYVITAESDHIAPWRSVYTGAAKIGGTVRFVLSNSGHIAGVVNPPSPKSRHWFGESDDLPASPDDWRDDAGERKASWWEDWTPWIAERAGKEVSAPKKVGSDAHPPLEPSSGRYVLTG